MDVTKILNRCECNSMLEISENVEPFGGIDCLKVGNFKNLIDLVRNCRP